MYQSDQVFLCCRHSYWRLFLFYVHRFISFSFLFVFKSFFTIRMLNMTCFCLQRYTTSSTRLIFACLYFPVVEIWFIRVRKVLEEFEGEYDFCLLSAYSVRTQGGMNDVNIDRLGNNAFWSDVWEPYFPVVTKEIFPPYHRYFIAIQTTLLLAHMIKYTVNL